METHGAGRSLWSCRVFDVREVPAELHYKGILLTLGIHSRLLQNRRTQTSVVTIMPPVPRPKVPPRSSDNNKRALLETVPKEISERLLNQVHYRGYNKHKKYPERFGLEPYKKHRGDATLCDEHAGFTVADMYAIPQLLRRGIQAGLIGDRLIWTVVQSGWIMEARLTNSGTDEYHGYPVRTSEAIAGLVFERFAPWVSEFGNGEDKASLHACKALYGFR